MTPLPHLIEALEKAKEGSAELDWLIADYLGEIPEHKITETGNYGWHRRRTQLYLTRYLDSEGRRPRTWLPDCRSQSVDVALEFVPEGLKVSIEQLCSADGWIVKLRNKPGEYPARLWTATHITLPCAVVDAALRARQEEG